MTIQTDRLLLREMTEDDFAALYAILADPETMQHYPRPYDEAGVHRWIRWCRDSYAKHGFGLWAVTLKDTGEFIGDCGVTMQPIHGQWLPEVGYHISKAHWRTAMKNGMTFVEEYDDPVNTRTRVFAIDRKPGKGACRGEYASGCPGFVQNGRRISVRHRNPAAGMHHA